MQEIITTILLAALGSSSLSTVVLALLNRKWATQDKKDDKLDAIMDAQKVLMIDRVRYLGTSYINSGQITLFEKENLKAIRAFMGRHGRELSDAFPDRTAFDAAVEACENADDLEAEEAREKDKE